MIVCPKCGGESGVKDSRPTGVTVRRRRVCSACGERWTTFEVMIEPDGDRLSVKRIAAELASLRHNLDRADEIMAALDTLYDAPDAIRAGGTGSPGTSPAGEAERQPAGQPGAAEGRPAPVEPEVFVEAVRAELHRRVLPLRGQ